MKKIVLLSVILLTTSFSKDLFELGLEAYDKGKFDKAAKQWQKACEADVSESCSNLGVLYENGQGVQQDFHKAAKLFEKACDDGYSQSCNNLGNLYSKGQSVKQDHLKAAKLWQKACDDEISPSCSNLGVL